MKHRYWALAKVIIKKTWLDIIFTAFWAMILLGIYELFFDLWKAGIIEDPIWSEVYGGLHHLYFFHIVLILCWYFLRVKALIKSL